MLGKSTVEAIRSGVLYGYAGMVDGILGRGEKNGRLTIPTPAGPLQVKGLRDVVRVRGGGSPRVPGFPRCGRATAAG